MTNRMDGWLVLELVKKRRIWQVVGKLGKKVVPTNEYIEGDLKWRKKKRNKV